MGELREPEPTPDTPHEPTWERRALRLDRAMVMATFLALSALAWATRQSDVSLWLTVPTAAFAAWSLYLLLTRRVRRRQRLRRQTFPQEWNIVLERDVTFFRVLEPAEKQRFRKELQVFLGEKLITGVDVTIDDTVRVLTGASAIIPIFGFPEWEWDQISEVLIYPSRFDESFDSGEGDGQAILGMVGTGAMNRMMILAKPDLIQGFRNASDKRNVGLHEFAHLVDKADGHVDGLPAVGLDRQAIGPWIELVRRKMAEIESGDSDISGYALTNEAEFFAVATEYFFERPGEMERKHPELYRVLAQVFRQDLRSRAGALLTAARNRPRSPGRNSPCPCGSGIKFKKCCLRRART